MRRSARWTTMRRSEPRFSPLLAYAVKLNSLPIWLDAEPGILRRVRVSVFNTQRRADGIVILIQYACDITTGPPQTLIMFPVSLRRCPESELMRVSGRSLES